jgi:hypothetical protein
LKSLALEGFIVSAASESGIVLTKDLVADNSSDDADGFLGRLLGRHTGRNRGR